MDSVIDASEPTAFEQRKADRKRECEEEFYLALRAEKAYENFNQYDDPEQRVVLKVNDHDARRLYEKLKERYENQ